MVAKLFNYFLSLALAFFVTFTLFYAYGFSYDWYIHLYKKDNYFFNVPRKIHDFYQSDAISAKGSDVLRGDWDRLCLLNSHQASKLNSILNRHLTLTEWLYWQFRVEFVDFDNNGGILIFEKNNRIQGLSLMPIFTTPVNQGCYSRHELKIEKFNIESSPFHINFVREKN